MKISAMMTAMISLLYFFISFSFLLLSFWGVSGETTDRERDLDGETTDRGIRMGKP
jgi:hypothetical protein